MKIIALSLACLMLLVSCQYSPHAHRLTKVKPSIDEIVGDYILEDVFNSSGPRVKNLEVLLTLRADGSFYGKNIPESNTPLYEVTDIQTLLIEAGGVWTLGQTGTVGPEGRPSWGIYLRDNSKPLGAADLIGNPKPDGLIFQFGDPDSGDAMLLKKK